jgi:hypothetical protein
MTKAEQIEAYKAALDKAEDAYAAACERRDWSAAAAARKSMLCCSAYLEWLAGSPPAPVTLH